MAAGVVWGMLVGGGAIAQDASSGSGRPMPRQYLSLQVPSDLASPAAVKPPAASRRQRDDCAPRWPCRLRVFGIIEKNGGIGLKGPALTW